MKISTLQAFILVYMLPIFSAAPCTNDHDCGWHGKCAQGSCICEPGYSRKNNDRYCVDDLCGDSRCLECWDSQKCSKCIGFIEEGTGRCLNKCSGTYSFLVEGSQVGRVCEAESKEVWTTMYTIITVACVAGALLIFIIILVCCLKFKSNRDRKQRIEMHSKQMDQLRREKEQRLVSQRLRAMNGYSPYAVNGVNVRSRADTVQQMARLEKHVDVLTHMYMQSKREIHRYNVDTPKCLDLRNIAHHLGRVLMLLRDKDSRLPEDAPVLLDWTERLLVDFLTAKQTQSAPASRRVTPGNTLQRLTSTFRPDQPVVLSNGHLPGDESPSNTTMSFTFERGRDHTRDLAEISMVELQDQSNWTESVVV